MIQNERLDDLSRSGVSVWLDDLSRDLISSGRLAELVETRSVVGVTTNPAIFHAALTTGAAYDEQIGHLDGEGHGVDAVIQTVTTDDVRAACDVLAPVYQASGTIDGRVSIEVDPRLAHDVDATVAQAIELWRLVDRPNLLIKIPATTAGLTAITDVLAEGISVNVTLIFSVERYIQVVQAYLDGLDAASRAGRDLASIHSVASFFVSRVDTEVDARLEAIGTPAAHSLKGQAALANARLAYTAFQQAFERSDRFQALAAAGARPQRPLWASTGVKNDQYPDTLYVSELIAPATVNTMPAATLEAFADHGTIPSPRARTGKFEEPAALFEALGEVGIDLRDVFHQLEHEGICKFQSAWSELLTAVAARLTHH
ncbi:transaldolase [Dietzia sp. NPDC055340]|uniref:transaldolase n=1 Tax=Arthrobacter koreensis TaxID=199136 RepID=UPI00366B740A